MTRVETLVRQFAKERQLANAYMKLARGHLLKAKETEDRIRRLIKRDPLPKRERTRLITLIETGEVEYVPLPPEDAEPF